MSSGDRSLLRTLVRDYVAAAVVQWLVLGSGLYLFHLVAVRDGAGGFAYYQIARGMVSTLQPLVSAGLTQGLQRYLPRTGSSAVSLAGHAFGTQTAVVVVVVLGGAAVAPWTSRLLGLGGVVPAVGTEAPARSISDLVTPEDWQQKAATPEADAEDMP